MAGEHRSLAVAVSAVVVVTGATLLLAVDGAQAQAAAQRIVLAGSASGSNPAWWQQGSTFVVVGALVAAAVIAALVRRLVVRERAASELVELRTAELSALNDQLASANRALAAAGRSKDEFLAAVSHELRTPLTVISGFVEALVRIRGDDPELERYLDPIARNVGRLHGLVTDLLTLVGIDGGALTPVTSAVDLGEALEAAPHELAGLADQLVVVRVPKGLFVEVDPAHFDRIVTNLLTNAVRHGAPPIEVTARDRGDGAAEVVVRDHGPGIPEDSVDEVFERFARGVQSASTPGTGLGLAIVRELIELNGGDVGYEPAEPGARFVIRLPLAEGSPSV